MVWLLGAWSAVGMGAMLVTLVVSRWLAGVSGRITEKDLAAADARMAVMREIVASIVPLK